MRQGKKFKLRKYIGYFIFGFILAALAFGSIGIKLARPDTSEPVQCEPFNIGNCEPSQTENCQPFYQPILRDCNRNVNYKLFNTLNTAEVETSGCERSNTNPACNPDRIPKDYIRECWKGGPPCTLDAAVETSGCERLNINPACNPDRMSKDYIRETLNGGPPCPLDAANSKDNDTIRSNNHEE